MPQPMHKIILQTYCDRHRKLLAFVEEMTDAQLRWLPQPCGNSIAFNLWHLARWADGMQVIFPGMTPELKQRLGERVQIWDSEELAAKWNFKSSQLGFAETGMGMSDVEARRLNFALKAEMLDYVRKVFVAVEEAV